MAEANNVGSASHPGEKQLARDAHFVFDYSHRRVPMPIISYMAVADAPGQPAESPARDALDLLQEAIEPPMIVEEELNSEHMHAFISEAVSSAGGQPGSGDQQAAVSVTTVIADRKHAYIGNVGTNRVYLLHNERLYDLTPTSELSGSAPAPTDNTLLLEAQQEGTPGVETAGGHIIGGSQAAVGYNEVEIVPGDIIILCTDGLYNAVSEEEMVEGMLSTPDVQRCASQLTRLAFSRNPSDNATMTTWQYVAPGESEVKLSRGKLSLVKVLFLGFMVLGIGCMSWALFNIWEQSHYSLKYSAGDINVKAAPSLVLHAPDKPLYPVYPAEGDNIGSLTIPALEQKLPIIEGTGADELKKGVGHFTQSVLPGLEDNCVLSGHRDTVFSRLGELKIGDQLIVETSAGTYTYEIKRGRIVDKDDKTVIVPADHAILTLTTCYPFVYIGSAPERYILIADLVISKK